MDARLRARRDQCARHRVRRAPPFRAPGRSLRSDRPDGRARPDCLDVRAFKSNRADCEKEHRTNVRTAFLVRAKLDYVARRATLVLMKTVPLSIRLDKQLRSLLAEGARRTSFNQRELLRRTLRLHLREVIEREAVKPKARITNIAPWPRGALAL